MVTEDSKIEFHDLRFGRTADEHKLFGVVRWDTDDSLKIDKDLMALIIFLKQGKTVKEASEIMRFSPTVVLSVLPMLEKAHFFKRVDQVSVEDRSNKIKPWLINVPRGWFSWVLHKPLLIFLLAFGITGTIIGIFVNGLPSYESFFWTTDLFTVFVSLFIVDILILFLHESSHFFVTKAVGGEAVIRINYRYVYIVAETESYHLAIVPKKMRYFVYSAGAILDLFIMGLLYWFLTLTKLFGVDIGILHNFLIAIVLMEILGIFWEFDVFLETDVYNFLSEYLGIENLRNDALKYIDERAEKWKRILLFPVKRLLRFISEDFVTESDDLRSLSKNDRKKLLLYIFVLLCGLIVVTFQYIFYSIPRDFTFVYQSSKDIGTALKTSNNILLIKSVVIIALIMLDYSLLFYLRIRKSKKFRKKR